MTTRDTPHCCAPERAEPSHPLPTAQGPIASTAAAAGEAAAGLQQPLPVPAGEFRMGDPFGEGYRADGEIPVHVVRLSAFAVDPTAVTNAEFAAFVAATGYRTEAEQYGSSAVFHLAVAAKPDDIIGRASGSPWWLTVRGADWCHPDGPSSGIDDRVDHPVVHVSHNDALAYCRWAGKRLLTEAEWEYAARGGHDGRRFVWGDELSPGGVHKCNIWQGTFPTDNTLDDGYLTTAPARSFDPNDFGLWNLAGNVWEWCADWFSPQYYRRSPTEDPTGPRYGDGRVMRGGSYLCHASYCHRYRVAARSHNTPESSAGNLGFRAASGSSAPQASEPTSGG
ncbi:formylglycine-generating enzyme required for sulfatase activity [Kribbella sp. VKM Ac-2527]|uniref:Formylglycine-generating enzyme required for sulfatase activity n=1 Tax=Kribbella caucasensis TaxID=2512215 RepID=A0A4R6KF69_9ACTN|nr:formylglycine-generating enzyme family protein [Kribbella sp. VKM Ac-2527]TDO46736.1 formylglycine-generating enzyme required for sulfatase activity [Kribbella sp. VKM Ac-2527]